MFFSDLVPCISIVSVLLVIFGFIAFLRYMNYRETIALAEKGLTRPERPEAKNNKGLLRWGIIVTALGIALSLGLYPIGFAPGYDYPLRLGPWMLGGFVPLFLGLSLILLHVLTRKN
jgi:sterol desaturase/sphingolipid hydroxylase (fatty acid hydroxylase superfamily)